MKPTKKLETLPHELGFSEALELRRLRHQWVAAMAAGSDAATPMAVQYRRLAEETIKLDRSMEKQIGLLVQIALARLAGGRVDAYLEDLREALLYAENARLEGATATLSEAIAAAENSRDG
jgi:hypothetical protein